MSNYYATARSNYFRVKDKAAFREVLNPFDLQIYDEADTLCLLSNSESGWDWYNPDNDEDTDPVELIAPHLQDGEVCILMESGAEKLRYISGYAEAFDSSGERVTLCLQDIYKLAKEKFGAQASITEAHY